MAVFTAIKNGDMDSAATFGGATTPVSGDEIALGGFTISCSSDKRALAAGITISGTGKLLILSGGAFKTAANIPNTCAVQFGEPTGEGAGPLPAVGSLDANASGEIYLNGNICVLGPCYVYTDDRPGKKWAKVSSKISTTQSVLDATDTDWRAGDIVSPFLKITLNEYAVTSFVADTATLTHAAMAVGYNDVGSILVMASCAALILRSGNYDLPVLSGGLWGYGAIYIKSATFGYYAVAGKINFHGRLVTRMDSRKLYGGSFSYLHGTIGKLFCPIRLSSDKGLSNLKISGGIVFEIGAGTGNVANPGPLAVEFRNVMIASPLIPFGFGIIFEVDLIDCTLPTPLLSTALSCGQYVRVANAAMTSETLYTAEGIATKVQHAALPGTNDLPDAYLLAPVTGRAYYDYWVTVKRGQTARIRFHAWLSTAGATCGYEIYEEIQVAGFETPLMAYTVPAETEILEWHRPTPGEYHNETGRDLLLRVRAWAEGDNCYVRCSPEQSGGAL